MNTLYGQLLKHADNTHSNSKTIATYINAIKSTKKERAKIVLTHRLFFLLSKLSIKAINNFSHLSRTIPQHKLLHTPEDIAHECYEVYQRCVKNVDIKDAKKFYFFLNTSLNRAIYRLWEKSYQKNFNIITNTEENVHLITNAGFVQHIDFSEIDLQDFDELEKEVIKFKVEGGKLSVFLKEHNIQSVIYYKILETVKEKLQVKYRDEYYFINSPAEA